MTERRPRASIGISSSALMACANRSARSRSNVVGEDVTHVPHARERPQLVAALLAAAA